MFKTILVPAAGNKGDGSVIGAAAGAARPFEARLDFHHAIFGGFMERVLAGADIPVLIAH